MLGTALLFWGAMCGRPLAGLLAALFVEARHWVRLRWDFDDSSYESAWKISLVLFVLTGVVIWLNESRYLAVLTLMTWMPVLLLPLQFVQAYGMRDSMDLGAFSMVAKRSRLRNQRLGLLVNPVRMNFGNVLVVVTLLAATVGADPQNPVFLPGLVLLGGWVLLSTRRCRWQQLLFVMLLAGPLGYVGGVGLAHLEEWLRWNRGGGEERYNPNFHTTLIGQRGRLSLSPEIIWRMKVGGDAPPPLLLRTAAFSNYLGRSWQNKIREFTELDPVLIGDKTHYLLADGVETAALAGLSSYKLRGTIRDIHPLPLSSDAVALRGYEPERVEKNIMGALSITPSAPVVDCTVLRLRGVNAEDPPRAAELSILAPREREAVKAVVMELGLDRQPDLRSKLLTLKQWFDANFRYTLDLTIKQQMVPKPSALHQFLTKVRAGHCEYFATAATLILREAGVPSRYAIGYAVMERDEKRQDYAIRGTHAHAWCRVWDDQRRVWIDFDPTPSGWYDGFERTDTWVQAFKDALKRLREDFYVWRTMPGNERMMTWWIVGIGGLLGTWVFRRLWRSRNRIDDGDADVARWEGEVVITPLHALESHLRRQLGARPAGMTLANWVGALRPRLADAWRLDELLELHQQLRFDPQAPPESCRERLQQLVGWLEQELGRLSAPEVVDHRKDLGG